MQNNKQRQIHKLRQNKQAKQPIATHTHKHTQQEISKTKQHGKTKRNNNKQTIKTAHNKKKTNKQHT